MDLTLASPESGWNSLEHERGLVGRDELFLFFRDSAGEMPPLLESKRFRIACSRADPLWSLLSLLPLSQETLLYILSAPSLQPSASALLSQYSCCSSHRYHLVSPPYAHSLPRHHLQHTRLRALRRLTPASMVSRTCIPSRSQPRPQSQ